MCQENFVGNHIAFKENHPTRQGRHIVVRSIAVVEAQLAAVLGLPPFVKVTHHGDEAVAPRVELIDVPLVKSPCGVVREVKLTSGNAEVAKPVQVSDGLVNQGKKFGEFGIALSLEPVNPVSSDRFFHAKVCQCPDSRFFKFFEGQFLFQKIARSREELLRQKVIDNHPIALGEVIDSGNPKV